MAEKDELRAAIAETRFTAKKSFKIGLFAAMNAFASGMLFGMIGGAFVLFFLVGVSPVLEYFNVGGVVNATALLAIVYIYGFIAHFFITKRFIRPRILQSGYRVLEDFWVTSFIVFLLTYSFVIYLVQFAVRAVSKFAS